MPRLFVRHARRSSTENAAKRDRLLPCHGAATHRRGDSLPPQWRQRPGGHDAGFRFSHSDTQHKKARASALSRASPASNSAIAARSSKKANQSSAVQAQAPGRRRRRRAGLCSASALTTDWGGGAGAVSTRSSSSTPTQTPAVRACLRASTAVTAACSSPIKGHSPLGGRRQSAKA